MSVGAAPRLYLSSRESGWEGLDVQAFHEPVRLEGWMTTPLPDVSLVLFAGGAMRMEWRQVNGPWQAATHRSGDLMLRAGGSPSLELRWQSLSDEPTQTLHMHLAHDLLAQMAGEVAGQDPAHLTFTGYAGLHDPLLAEIGFALWRELERPGPAGKVYAQSAAYLLAAHLLRHYTPGGAVIPEPARGLTHRQVRQVVDFIQAHLGEDLSLDALARQAGYSPYHFARLFRQTTGESPHHFLLHQRVERARCLLQDTDMPLAQIASETGFASQSHLSLAFKRHFGFTPRAYRRQR